MSSYYAKDGTPIADVLTWAARFEDTEYRRVGGPAAPPRRPPNEMDLALAAAPLGADVCGLEQERTIQRAFRAA